MPNSCSSCDSGYTTMHQGGPKIHFCKKTINTASHGPQPRSSSDSARVGRVSEEAGHYHSPECNVNVKQSQVDRSVTRRLLRLVRQYLCTTNGGDYTIAMWSCTGTRSQCTRDRHKSVTRAQRHVYPRVKNNVITNTANDMCTDKISDKNQRAASEVPVAASMPPSPQINRASSIGPIVGLSKKRSFRDNGLYECNYESIDSWSSSSNENDSSSAIWKLESSVKSVDSLIGKPKHYDKYGAIGCDKSNKIQYDSITVLPPPPPPPLPRARSFKHYRARTVNPWVAPPSSAGGRASSAPPISPMNQRKLYYCDR